MPILPTRTAFASITPRPAGKAPSGYRMAKAGDAGEIYLYGPIGASFWGDGISANQFRQDLKALGPVKTIDLRINSEGGDVFDGKAMYSLLVDHKANVHVHIDGLAASAASFIAMAGDTIAIAEGGFVMIHNAWGMAIGDADEMRKTAQMLDTVNGTIIDLYAARTKQTPDQIKKWMAAETWMTGAEAVEHGFADEIVANLKAAAAVRGPALDRFRHLPAALRPNRAAALKKIAAARR